MLSIQSTLLNTYSHRLRYGFSTKPYFVAGTEAGQDELFRHRRYWLQAFGMGRTRHPLRLPVQVLGDVSFNATQAYSQPADAIVLDAPELPAVVFSADCTPVLLYAPDVHCGAVIHCGWKSTAQQLATKMVKRLHQAHGANPAEMIAVIGPALSQAGFEIDADVYTQLQASLPPHTDASVWAYQHAETHKYHASVPTINRLQLEQAGLLPQHIECLPYATDTHDTLFWSFRSGDWQRQGSFMMLLPLEASDSLINTKDA